MRKWSDLVDFAASFFTSAFPGTPAPSPSSIDLMYWRPVWQVNRDHAHTGKGSDIEPARVCISGAYWIIDYTLGR